MTFLLFFITLSLLILVHEWGHFYAARKLGVRVEEFGFGFPPNIVSTVKNGTRFVLNLLPIGGYVKIYGEQGEGSNDPKSFASRPVWQRFIIVAAGVFMNAVLAWALFTAAHGIGISQAVDTPEGSAITIIAVEKNSPADRAGMLFGDSVRELRIGSELFPVPTIEDFQRIVKEHAGSEVTVVLRRNGSVREVTAVPRTNPPADSGALGVALEYVGVKKSAWHMAPVYGLQSTYYAFTGTIIGFKDMIRQIIVKKEVPQDVSGPIGVFRFAGEVKDLGISYILQFIAVLSVNLAILNALPIPALDGGRMFFMIIEKIRRKAMPQKFEGVAHAIGFAALILLMILITIRDVRGLF